VIQHVMQQLRHACRAGARTAPHTFDILWSPSATQRMIAVILQPLIGSHVRDAQQVVACQVLTTNQENACNHIAAILQPSSSNHAASDCQPCEVCSTRCCSASCSQISDTFTGWRTGSLSAEEPVLTVHCSADIEMHELWQFVRVRLVFTPGTRCPG
jgi:hypothetical protein